MKLNWKDIIIKVIVAVLGALAGALTEGSQHIINP